jgi:hypothetical protein
MAASALSVDSNLACAVCAGEHSGSDSSDDADPVEWRREPMKVTVGASAASAVRPGNALLLWALVRAESVV